MILMMFFCLFRNMQNILVVLSGQNKKVNNLPTEVLTKRKQNKIRNMSIATLGLSCPRDGTDLVDLVVI